MGERMGESPRTCDAVKGCDQHNLHCSFPHCPKGAAQYGKTRRPPEPVAASSEAGADVDLLDWLQWRLGECDAEVSDAIFGDSTWTDVRAAIRAAKATT